MTSNVKNDTGLDLVGGGSNGSSNSGTGGSGSVNHSPVYSVVSDSMGEVHSDLVGIAAIVLGFACVLLAVAYALSLLRKSHREKREMKDFERLLSDYDFKPSEIKHYFDDEPTGEEDEEIDDFDLDCDLDNEDDYDFTPNYRGEHGDENEDLEYGPEFIDYLKPHEIYDDLENTREE